MFRSDNNGSSASMEIRFSLESIRVVRGSRWGQGLMCDCALGGKEAISKVGSG